MIIELLGRGMGKTAKAVELANKTGSYLIVANGVLAREIAKNYKCDRYPVTIQEFMNNKLKGSFVESVVIDDADLILQQIFGRMKIEGITLTDA
jgi:hypothetical protein